MARAGVKTAGRGAGDVEEVEGSGGSGSDVAGSDGVGDSLDVAESASSISADDVASASGSGSDESLQAAINTRAEHIATPGSRRLKPERLR
jgi:hypothetical protein